LTVLKQDCKTLKTNLATKEKEFARMKKTSVQDLSEKVANHAAQVKAIRDLHSDEIKEKGSIIRDQADKLQELRKFNNLVSHDFIILHLIFT